MKVDRSEECDTHHNHFRSLNVFSGGVHPTFDSRIADTMRLPAELIVLIQTNATEC